MRIKLTLVLLALALLGACVALTVCFWGWLRSGGEVEAANSETLQNVGLMTAGFLALIFAAWRAQVAGQQAEAARQQAGAARQQVETAERGVLNDNYGRATEMLGSDVRAVRMGGINSLQDLAEQHPDLYHIRVMQQLCLFVQHPPEFEGQPITFMGDLELGEAYGASNAQDYAAAGTVEMWTIREDIQAAVDSITACHAGNLDVETRRNYWIDLHGADLRGVDLSNRDLSRAPERDEGAPFDRSMIRTMWTDMRGVKLHHANLIGTNLTGVNLSHALGLTQDISDDACADARRPPVLDSAFDGETGNALAWKKAPSNQHDP